jgi:predicted AlkP superfamily pyrophosphatase or phosphodiesterase
MRSVIEMVTRTALSCQAAVIAVIFTGSALLAAAFLPASLTAQSRPADPPIRLVVAITIDQFQEPYIERYADEFTGGLARLLKGGAVLTNAYQDHGVTETAPGHASVLSGRFPRSTGIMDNDTYGDYDATSPVLGGGGQGASPVRYRGGTFIDWVRFADLQSRGLSVSRKSRAAILPFGRSHQPAFWYVRGRFTTSTWFADTLPSWVKQFNDRRIPSSYAGATWDLLMPASQYSEKDSVAIENNGRDILFPHRLPADSTILTHFIEYPMMDQLTLDFALAGVHALRLGAGNHTDVLHISLSSTDYVGHHYGPDSREIHDQILRVDRSLGMFMDSLYATLDSSRIAIVLTADHGITPFPELHSATAQEAKDKHANMRPAVAAARAVLRNAGVDTTAVSFDSGMLLVNRRRLPAGFDIEPAAAAFSRVAQQVPAVASVMRRADLARMDTVRNTGARRWLHTLADDNPAVLLLTLRDGAIWGSGIEAEHGTTRDIDAHVPIIFYGAPFRAGKYAEFARTVDIAPTLAWVLGVTPYEKIDGVVLRKVLR